MPQPDYKDDLVFPPQMTWQEFVRSARKIAPKIRVCSDRIMIRTLCFTMAGDILADRETSIAVIAESRSLPQMLQIIKNMFEK